MVAPNLIYGGLVLALVAAALAVLLARHAWELRADLAPTGRPDVWSSWCASTGSGAKPPKRRKRPSPVTLEDLEARRSTLTHWVARFGVPGAMVPDIVQRVIEEAWFARDTYRPADAELDSWLHSFARNLSSNYLGSAWHKHTNLAGTRFEGFATNKTPEAALEQAECVQRAWVIVAKLPAHLAALWTRYEVEGETARELAAELKIPISTFWGRLQQARREITRELARIEAREARTMSRRRRR